MISETPGRYLVASKDGLHRSQRVRTEAVLEKAVYATDQIAMMIAEIEIILAALTITG